MRELHLFAGAGGGVIGGMLLGHTCVCAVEIEPYRRKVLLQRQRDGILPKFPIWDDVRTFDGTPWAGLIDVVCSGFPCQRHSDIGKLHGSTGFNGWPDTLRIIGEVFPPVVWLENVPAILAGYFWRVAGDLALLGYDAKWGVFSACSIGAPHTRERLFCMAHPRGLRPQANECGLAQRTEGGQSSFPSATNRAAWLSRLPQPTVPDRPYELARWMDQIGAIGDGQIPQVVRLAWETLSQ